MDFSVNSARSGAGTRGAIPIVALDVADQRQALALVERLPAAEWVKVGLQLFTAAGPAVVRALRESGRRVFLDLKLHDIPNTVARAVEAAAKLDVDLLTLHAAGGAAMMRAARAAVEGAEGGAGRGPRLLAVTLLTSLAEEEVARLWDRAAVSLDAEVARLARMAVDAGMHGVVASVAEVPQIRAGSGYELLVLTPGIRLPGDAAGDQARIATPQAAARAGADFLVVGRSVTSAADPAAAFGRVLASLAEVEHRENRDSPGSVP